MTYKWFISVVFGALLVGASQFNRPSIPTEQTSPFGLDVKIVARTTAGYSSALSSILWVRFVFSFAESLFDIKDPRPLVGLAKAVAALDTNWSYPRLVAAWILPQFRQIPAHASIDLLRDGATRFPKEWRFRTTWAQYVLDTPDLDSISAFDSAANILLPLSRIDADIPEYARDLAFTLLHKSGKPDEAISILIQTYAQIPDPLIRYQFQNKIGDLLRRNEVSLASDSTAFIQAIAGMLDSQEASQIGMAKQILVRLVQPEHKERALAEAHQLAEQFKVYQKQVAAGR